MATKAEYVILIKGNSSLFAKAAQQATRSAKSIGSSLRNLGTNAANSLAGLTLRIGKLAAALGAASAFGFVGFGIKLAAEAEQAQVAFEVMLGSAETAQKVLGDLRDFAASTPFQFPDLRKSAQLLIAFGSEADNVVEELKRIGDVSAGVGAPVAEIAELYGKARVQGRLFAEDINQLVGRGIPIISQLARQFNITEGEVKDLVKSGEVGFGNLEQAFIDLTSEGGRFFDLTKKQSGTLGGLFSTFKDQVGLVAQEFGTELLPALKATLQFASELVERFKNFAIPQAQSLIEQLGLNDADQVEEILKRLTVTVAQLGVIALRSLSSAIESLQIVFDQLKKIVDLLEIDKITKLLEFLQRPANLAADFAGGGFQGVSDGIVRREFSDEALNPLSTGINKTATELEKFASQLSATVIAADVTGPRVEVNVKGVEKAVRDADRNAQRQDARLIDVQRKTVNALQQLLDGTVQFQPVEIIIN